MDVTDEQKRDGAHNLSATRHDQDTEELFLGFTGRDTGRDVGFTGRDTGRDVGFTGRDSVPRQVFVDLTEEQKREGARNLA